jgi:hypothetical protein
MGLHVAVPLVEAAHGHHVSSGGPFWLKMTGWRRGTDLSGAYAH